MTEVTPTYYAAGTQGPLEFNIKGRHFNDLPDTAVAILAEDNNDPEQYINSQSENLIMPLTRISDTEIIFNSLYTGVYSAPKYLGVIVSADRTTIYWVNNTRPLP